MPWFRTFLSDRASVDVSILQTGARIVTCEQKSMKANSIITNESYRVMVTQNWLT